jgi:hypothetical protein
VFLINPKTQATNFKWFDRPFDRLTILSKPVESLKVERVEGLTTLSKGEG